MLKYVLCNSCKKPDHDQLTPLAVAAMACDVADLRIILKSKEQKTINEFFAKRELQLTPLQWCLKGDYPSSIAECARLLVEAGADVNLNEPGIEGRSAVHMAAEMNLPEVLDYLVDHKGDVNVPDMSKNLPLHYICKNPETTESLEVFRRLINHTSDIDSRNNNNESPFSIAVVAGNCQIVEELADSDCDINVSGGCYIYELFVDTKIQKSKSKMVEKLIKLGCDANVNIYGMSPLMLAVKVRDVESIKILLKHRADVKAQDTSGAFVTDYCFENKSKCNTDILELLLQFESQINISNLAAKYLQKIMENGDSETLKILVAKGFDINQIGEMNENILHFLARDFGAYCSKFDHFLDQVNVNHEDVNGTTPLMVAVEISSMWRIPCMKYLLNRGADVNIVNKDGQTVLMICVEHSPSEMELLLDAGADVNTVNKHGQTALMISVEKGCNYQQLKVLLNAGSNPNIQDKNGRTVLQYLNLECMELYCNSLKLCLQHGGALSLNIKTASGCTALQYVLGTERFSMFWHLLAENCSLKSLDTPRTCTARSSRLPQMMYLAYEARAHKMLFHMKNKKVMFGKILYVCGAPKEIIKKTIYFLPNEELVFDEYCNNMSLKEMCRRVLRNAIGAGIQQKLSKNCQIPGLFHDFLMLKHMFISKVFDPNEISNYDICDKDNVFHGVNLNHNDDIYEYIMYLNSNISC